MTSNFLSKSSNITERLYLPVTVLFFLALAHNHFQLITFELPLDYNEPAMQTITATIVSGENPYSFENQPSRTSGYPIPYNILVAPMAVLFGNTLQLHRMVTGLFILAACLLTFLVTNKVSNSARDSFAASSLLYAGLLYYATPVASPSSIGVFLFLSSLFVAWYCRFSNRSLLAALILGTMAFYGKQYFIAGLGYIALYLFIAVSKTKGVLFGASSLAALMASLTLMHQFSPYFLDISIFAGSSAALIASNQTMLIQLRDYGLINLPLLTVLIVQGALVFFARSGAKQTSKPSSGRQALFNLSNINAPLLRFKIDYFWYCFACSLTIIVFSLGKNPGNYLSYLFQLISPFFLAGTFIIISRSTKFTGFYRLLAMVSFCISFAILSHDFSLHKLENWKKLEQAIATADKVYGSPIILGEILENGGDIYRNGHTRYFPFAENKPSFMVKENREETVHAIWEKHVEKIHSMIAAQEFDLIILDQWTSIPNSPPGPQEGIDGASWLKKHYRSREVITVFLAKRRGGGRFPMQIWEPIPSPLPIDAVPASVTQE